jgi:hypothetical protein
VSANLAIVLVAIVPAAIVPAAIDGSVRAYKIYSDRRTVVARLRSAENRKAANRG